MIFRLYSQASGGSALWSESLSVSVNNGVFDVLLAVPSTFFDGSNRYLGVTVGNDAEMTPRRQVASVPYAYWAEEAARAEEADTANYATSAGDADTVDGKQANEFADTGHAHSALNAADGNPQSALVVDNNGNVGIGTTEFGAKLDVNGAIQYQAIKQVDLGSLTTYNVKVKRYHIEATKAQVRNTVPLDMAIVNELCKDEDGCAITLGMKDWENNKPGVVASYGPYRLFMSQTSNWWRRSSVSNGSFNDGNGSVNHILQTYDCYFTDGEYSNGTGTDSSVQLGLLNFNATFTDPDMVCVLTIED
jgi:hypothetical protein